VPIGLTVLAAAGLRPSAYRSIAHDPRFWPAALVVVLIGAVSHALLGVGWATVGGWAVVTSVVPALVSNVDMWLAISLVGWVVGRLFGTTASLGGILRAVGVATLPSALYGLGIVPPILLLMAAWWLATTFAGLKGALGLRLAPTVAAVGAGAGAGYLLAVATTTYLSERLG
jgi:hypothetical protein